MKMLKALMTRTSSSDPVDVPKTHDAMIDVLIAIRYMCIKRMIYPVVAGAIERRNEFLVLSKACIQTKPENVFTALQNSNCQINACWLLRAFTRTALHFNLRPVIVDRSGDFQPLVSRYFTQDDPDFAYRRHYDTRNATYLTEISRPRMYLLNGLNYGILNGDNHGIQVSGEDTEEIQSCERS